MEKKRFSMGHPSSGERSSEVAIEFQAISKRYRPNVPLLDSVTFSVNYGEVVGLFGPSGSGKSTLLKIASALLVPDSGTLRLDGNNVFPNSKAHDIDISKLRGSLISYIPQDDYLFESLNVRENVALAMELSHHGPAKDVDTARKVDDVLQLLGILKLAERQILDISAGERRRTVIGRGLVKEPKILIADEPTSSLDPETTGEFLNLVRERSQKQKMAILIASHDVAEIKSIADRVYGVKNNTLVQSQQR